MANRIKIRHGSSIPTTSSLLPYELGWNTANKVLYINDNGAIKSAASTVSDLLTIGLRETSTSPSSETSINRIAITPYFHTGGPWYIKSMDDSTNAYLALYYGSSQLLKIKHNGVFSTTIQANINLNRNGAITYGRIQWWKDSYKTWTTYMSDATSGTCPSGGAPSTLGNVTTWAIRSYIENGSGYGWLWESAAETNTGTPTARMALSAYDGTLQVAGLIKTTLNSNTVTIGSQNASFCHIYNSASIPFIFNNSVLTTGGNLGDGTYPFDNLTLGRSNGAGIYYKGTKATYRMIRFIDNTADTYGNGISIGGGGQTIIGGGESADVLVDQAGTAGAEVMWIGNDGTIELFPNQQSGYTTSYKSTFETNGNLTTGAIRTRDYHFNTNLLSYYVGNSTQTGTIKITLPNTNSSTTMEIIKVYIYDYSTKSGSELLISGYTYNNSTWYNTNVTTMGCYNYTVRFGYDGSHYCILLGTTTSTWSYCNIGIKDVYQHYGNTGSSLASDYIISLITSESGITITSTQQSHPVLVDGNSTARKIWVTTSSSYSSSYANGDIVLVKAS